MSTHSPVAVITGGGGALGSALALQAARRGYRVAILDRSESAGEACCQALLEAGAECFWMAVDVRRERDLNQAVTRVLRRWGQLDLWINNAGIATAGPFEALSSDDWQQQLDVNLIGTVHGCRAAATAMARQGNGQLVNIAAAAGLFPSPGLSAYNSVSAALIALSETLQAELSPLGIRVSVACPTFFQSPFMTSVRATDPLSRQRFMRLAEQHQYSAEEVAERLFKELDGRRFLLLPHRDHRRLWWLKRLSPKRFRAAMRDRARRLRHPPLR